MLNQLSTAPLAKLDGKIISSDSLPSTETAPCNDSEAEAVKFAAVVLICDVCSPLPATCKTHLLPLADLGIGSEGLSTVTATKIVASRKSAWAAPKSKRHLPPAGAAGATKLQVPSSPPRPRLPRPEGTRPSKMVRFVGASPAAVQVKPNGSSNVSVASPAASEKSVAPRMTRTKSSLPASPLKGALPPSPVDGATSEASHEGWTKSNLPTVST
mmetsp:Transcript_70236/g.177642  ORF Transcript_70236/g.177642 Transcript_70236/m.177642 type:complete len:214 (+) Transcript_70236:783-1424(+)